MDKFKAKSARIWLCKTDFCTEYKKEVKMQKCHIRERCTRQLALTAGRNVKFHSSQTAQGQYTAESATQNEDHHADIKLFKLIS